MDFSSVQKYLLSKHQAKETFPSGPEVAVYKVCHKMFATLTQEAGVARVNLKCDPEEAVALRAKYPAVQPGHDMNKKHGETVCLDDSITEDEIRQTIENPYELVINDLPSNELGRLLASKR